LPIRKKSTVLKVRSTILGILDTLGILGTLGTFKSKLSAR
jgi:hypothetical protein